MEAQGKGTNGWFSNLRGDLLGGLTAGIVALPLALGFGVASGLDGLEVAGLPLNGALAGLLGAIAVGLCAAVFGGTPAQISGPTGPLTVVVAGLVTSVTGDPRWLFVTIALAGLMQIGFGLLRIGRYVNYIPYPVVSGFMTGIGVIIVLLQLPVALGGASVKSPVAALQALPGVVTGGGDVVALALAGTTMALVYLTPRITRAVPGTLVALIGVSAATYALGLDVSRLGDIPSGRPQLMLPAEMDPSMFLVVLAPAFTLALLASIDSLLTSVVADAITRTRHDSDRELVGQGLGNLLSGLFGGLAGAGATMRTVVNVRSGGRGRLSGVTHSVFLIAVLIGLGPLAAQIPHAVLAGILITVGIGIIDYKGLKHLLKVPPGDAVVMGTVLILTVVVDLVTAVGVGLVLASLLLVKRFSDEDPASPSPLRELASRVPWVPELRLPDDVVEGIHVVHVEGSLFFGNAGPLRRRILRLRHQRALVLDLSRVRYVDQSGAYALQELIEVLREEGDGSTEVVLAGLAEQPASTLARLGIAPGLLSERHIALDVERGVAIAIELVTGRDIVARGVHLSPPTAHPVGV